MMIKIGRKLYSNQEIINKLKWIKKDHKKLDITSPVKNCTTCFLIKGFEKLMKPRNDFY